MAACEEITENNVLEFVESFNSVLIDCDGVLWNGPEIINGAPEAFQKLQALGKKIFPVTNNSTKTRKEYEQKCAKLGFPVSETDIIGSAFVTGEYLKHVINLSGKIFLLGSAGLFQELTSAGFEVEWDRDLKVEDDVSNKGPQVLKDLELDPLVTCVVVGFDMYFNYAKLTKATSYLQNKNILFVASNTDAALPMGPGKVLPGTGSLVKAVEIASGRHPDHICGKPHRPMFDVLHELHGINPDQSIMIGDRLETDIQLAHNCGFRAVLVLTGVSSLEDVEARKASSSTEHKKQIPHYYIDSLNTLGNLLKNYVPKS